MKNQGFSPSVIIIALLIGAIGTISVGKAALNPSGRAQAQETLQDKYERLTQTDYIGALITIADVEGR